MQDTDLSTVVMAAGGLMLSAIGWFLNREIKRNDEYGDRIDQLEKTIPGLVGRADLDRAESTIIDAIKDLKTEVRGERERINRLTEHRP